MVAIVNLRFRLRARTIAASMAIDRPEATDGAPLLGVPVAPARWGGLWGLTAKEDFLVSRGMGAAQGKKV